MKKQSLLIFVYILLTLSLIGKSATAFSGDGEYPQSLDSQYAHSFGHVVTTPSGKTFSLEFEGGILRDCARTGETPYKSEGFYFYNPDFGRILKLVAYGTDGLVGYTTDNRIIFRTSSEQYIWNNVGPKLDAVDKIAVLGDNLYVVNLRGELSVMNLKTGNIQVLENTTWRGMAAMISVGNHLVFVRHSDGRMWRFDPSSKKSKVIGKNYKAGTEFLALDENTVVSVSSNGVVHAKDINTETYQKVGELPKGASLEIGNKRLLKKNNAFLVHMTPVAAEDSTL